MSRNCSRFGALPPPCMHLDVRLALPLPRLSQVPQTTARILLSHYMWNTERLVTDFLESPSRYQRTHMAS